MEKEKLQDIKNRNRWRGKVYKNPIAVIVQSDKKEGEWVCGELHIETKIPHIHAGEKKYPIDVETIGQYTCKKDKCGKYIYEGDIVKAPLLDPIFKVPVKDVYVYAAIEYRDGSFVVTYNEGLHVYLEDLIEKIEVVGNIYDDDLLEKVCK